MKIPSDAFKALPQRQRDSVCYYCTARLKPGKLGYTWKFVTVQEDPEDSPTRVAACKEHLR